ncbi:MAG: serine/threonine protein kinase, partial [Planctomycetes bacterium]|nr:serine/threonine protein kinase [Planctomycetota bacterium]
MSAPGGDDDLALTRPGGMPPPPPLPRIPGVTLQHEIARGGMGVVYRGRQEYIDREVAVKLLSTELTDRAFVARFRREAKILAGIDHPNIVGCHFAGQTDDGQSFLVMEFVAGASLKRHIAD